MGEAMRRRIFQESNSDVLRRRRREARAVWVPVVVVGSCFAAVVAGFFFGYLYY